MSMELIIKNLNFFVNYSIVVAHSILDCAEFHYLMEKVDHALDLLMILSCCTH